MAEQITFSRQRLRQAEKTVVYTLLVFAALAAALLALTDTSSVRAAFSRLNAGALGVFVLTLVAGNFLRMHRYAVFARTLGIAVPVRTLYLYYVAGMALIPTPGKIGTALRFWLMNRRYGIPYRQSTPMFLMDLVTDFLAFLVIMLAAVAALGNAAGLGLGLLGLMGLLGLVVSIFVWPFLPRRLVKLLYWGTGRRRPRTFAGLLGVLRKLKKLFGLRPMLWATGLSILGWGIVVGGLYVLAQGLGLALTPAMLALALGGGLILGGLTMMPGGLGGTEATMVAVLGTFGMALPQAMALVIVIRVGTLWLPTAAGFVALPFALKTLR